MKKHDSEDIKGHEDTKGCGSMKAWSVQMQRHENSQLDSVIETHGHEDSEYRKDITANLQSESASTSCAQAWTKVCQWFILAVFAPSVCHLVPPYLPLSTINYSGAPPMFHLVQPYSTSVNNSTVYFHLVLSYLPLFTLVNNLLWHKFSAHALLRICFFDVKFWIYKWNMTVLSLIHFKAISAYKDII